jgi:cytoskeletal protein CcmA (bactofilin family)
MRNRRESASTGGSAGGTTLISSGTTVKGDITFTGQLDVEGSVVGSIQADTKDAVLRVVAGGKVSGEIKVPHATINGNVEGDIHTSERFEMAVGAKVNGGLRHTSSVADDLAAKREARVADTVPVS